MLELLEVALELELAGGELVENARPGVKTVDAEAALLIGVVNEDDTKLAYMVEIGREIDDEDPKLDDRALEPVPDSVVVGMGLDMAAIDSGVELLLDAAVVGTVEVAVNCILLDRTVEKMVLKVVVVGTVLDDEEPEDTVPVLRIVEAVDVLDNIVVEPLTVDDPEI